MTDDTLDILRGAQVFKCYECNKYILMQKQKLKSVFSTKEKKKIVVALCPKCFPKQ